MKLRLLLSAVVLAAHTAQSQPSATKVAPPLVVSGSDQDNYLRYLQSSALVGEYPWSIRGFSPREMTRLSVRPDSQPWLGRLEAGAGSGNTVQILPFETSARFNSSFPYGSQDGPIWAGRGLTSSVSGGFALSFGPLTAVLNPIAFRAENQSFTLMANGQTGVGIYANGRFPNNVDLPQKFGAGAYARIDWGESTVRVDLFGLAAGVSTATSGWGPMENYELVLGNNGPGIPRIFAGTSHPLNIGIGHIHTQMFWGRLDQSDYSPVKGSLHYSSWLETGTQRFATGLVAVFQPRGITGLEVGGTRFFHLIWPRSGLPHSYFTTPFGSVTKAGLPKFAGFPDVTGGGNSNQVASVFARWVHPSSGVEFYGEYAHEDHNWDLRDLVEEPDHSRMYALGLRKVLQVDSAQLSGLRAELVNYQLPTLGRNRGEGGVYVHSFLRQGHTILGQPLGADVGVGTGAGSVIAWDRFTSTGKSTLSLTRTVRQDDGTFYRNGIIRYRTPDVLYGLGVERTHFFKRVDLTTAGTLVREFNRDFLSDAWNLNLQVGLRYHPGVALRF